ncbi:hypothetical protein AHF37_05632 [Paragonimus kellicotti]|nr:hypothetical protein AHF37_05632 [Paragonimus kellicotti]
MKKYILILFFPFQGPNASVLLIRNFQHADHGVYGCVIVDPLFLTAPLWTSTVRYQLRVQDQISVDTVTGQGDFVQPHTSSGRNFLQNSSPKVLVDVTADENVTLYCVPPPAFASYTVRIGYNSTGVLSARHQFVPLFGSILLLTMLMVAYFIQRSSVLLSVVQILSALSSSADFPNTEDAFLPEFVSLPQSRLHVDPHSTESVQIICLAWPPPPLGQVTYYYYPAAINRLSSTATTAPLHPVPIDWLDRNRSALVLASKELVRRLTFHDLHCLASTQFGAVLSPPFQVVLDHTRLEAKAVDQLMIQNVPINGTAVLQCNRPHLGPVGPIRFLVNGSALPDVRDKFLMITPMRPPNASVLLIRNFQHADHGVYGCVIVDPLFLTAPLWTSTVRYQLRVQDQISVDTVTGQGDFVQPHTSSGRNFLQNSSPKVLVDVTADENVTLYCVPPPAFASYTVRIGYNSTGVLSARHQFVPLFDQISVDTVTGQGDFVQPHTSSGRNFLQNSSPKVLVDVTADENVTLYCVPPPAFASYTVRIGYNSTGVLSARHQFVPLFGVLHISHLSEDDTGSYWCSAGNWTATVHLRVTHKPRVSIIPAMIHKTVGQSAQLSCTGSEHIPFAWYHNGIPLRSQTSSGAESSFHLETLTSSMTGIYQCVQQTADADWTSAQAVVRLNGTHLLRRSDFNHFQDTSLWNPLYFSSNLVITPSRRSIVVGCLSTQTHVSNISVDTLPAALYDLFPGTGTLQNRLRLAQLLQFVRLRWRKDGVSLQLPGHAYGSSSVEPHQFTLDLARSHDFGVYECAVYTDCAEPRLLFSHAMHVKSTEHKLDPNLSQPEPANKIFDMSEVINVLPTHGVLEPNSTDRGKRDAFSSFESVQKIPNSPHSDLMDTWVSNPDSFNQQDIWPNIPATIPRGVVSGLLAPSSLRQHLSILSATPIGDNLAVNITWSPMQADFYRIQFRHKSVPGQMWSKPITIDELIPECCSRQPTCCKEIKQFYFTNRKPDGLEPGRQYKFRIMAIITNADQHGSYVLDKSRWSQVVSFEHISKVAPVFTETERLVSGDRALFTTVT